MVVFVKMTTWKEAYAVDAGKLVRQKLRTIIIQNITLTEKLMVATMSSKRQYIDCKHWLLKVDFYLVSRFYNLVATLSIYNVTPLAFPFIYLPTSRNFNLNSTYSNDELTYLLTYLPVCINRNCYFLCVF